MLSEEEKKAIRNLENLSEYGLSTTLNQADLDKMKTVLNIITKLQKENEKYKYLYQKALDNTVSTDRENIQLKKQRVWIVYENRNEVCVYDDYIDEICVNENGVYYILKEACIDSKEKDIVLYEDTDKLVDKIKETMENIRKKEKNT